MIYFPFKIESIAMIKQDLLFCRLLSGDKTKSYNNNDSEAIIYNLLNHFFKDFVPVLSESLLQNLETNGGINEK